jgi:multidrug efflux pump subunit AcrA (membrane-fusion protein)
MLFITETDKEIIMNIFKNKKTEIRPHRRYGKRIVFISAVAVVAAAAIVVPNLLTLGRGADSSAVTVNEEVLTAQAAVDTIKTNITASGSLEAGNSVDISVAGDITVDEYLVKDGDIVSSGDAIATVDKSSVMTAIETVQKTMALLDARIDEINSCDDDTSVNSSADGRIKKIYAQDGDTATSVMSDNGAVMLMSLDGLMAADIERTSDIEPGLSVTVALSDGEEVSGKVTSVTDKTATVTLSDENADYGDTVSIVSEDGTSLGSAQLYIDDELKVVASAGVIDDIAVSEGDTVSEGDELFTLTDTRYSGEYSSLMYKRGILEDRMKELFEIYQSGQILADCDGEVSGIEDTDTEDTTETTDTDTTDTTETTATSETTTEKEKTSPSKMINSPTGEDDTGYTNTGATVTHVGYGAISVLMGSDPLGDIDYTACSGLDTSLFTQSSVITPDASLPVYSYSSDTGSWTAATVSDIEVGDILVITLNSSGSPVWIVRVAASTGTSASTGTTSSGTSAANVSTGSSGYSAGATGSSSIVPSSGIPVSSGSADSTPSDSSAVNSQTVVDSLTDAITTQTSESQTSAQEDYTVDETVIASIINTTKMSVTLTIDELDIKDISVGLSVSISLDAVKGKTYDGEVASIDTEGTNDGGNTKYQITVTMDRTDDMLVGMNATVLIPVSEDSVLCVPAQALTDKSATTVCYTSYDEESDTLGGETVVETGISDGTNVEIKSGITEGTTIYYRYASGLVYSFVTIQK